MTLRSTDAPRAIQPSRRSSAHMGNVEEMERRWNRASGDYGRECVNKVVYTRRRVSRLNAARGRETLPRRPGTQPSNRPIEAIHAERVGKVLMY